MTNIIEVQNLKVSSYTCSKKICIFCHGMCFWKKKTHRIFNTFIQAIVALIMQIIIISNLKFQLSIFSYHNPDDSCSLSFWLDYRVANTTKEWMCFFQLMNCETQGNGWRDKKIHVVEYQHIHHWNTKHIIVIIFSSHKI